jgi:hypothetical protein
MNQDATMRSHPRVTCTLGRTRCRSQPLSLVLSMAAEEGPSILWHCPIRTICILFISAMAERVPCAAILHRWNRVVAVE